MIGMNGPPAFGVDVANLRPGETTTVNATSDGFPFGLDQLPAGDYSVQAVLIPYKKAKRSDGHTIWVPMNEQRVIAPLFPGNPYSKSVDVHLDPAAKSPVALTLTAAIGPIARAPDTTWIKRVDRKSAVSGKRVSRRVTLGGPRLI